MPHFPPKMPQGLNGGLRDSIQSPELALEFKRIHDDHAILVSTGCTRDFCQAGRALHTDEPRVGENRALHTVEQEAENFLEDLYATGFYDSETAFQDRLEEVLSEIRDGAFEAVIRQDKSHRTAGGNWTQTLSELEFGVRRAWRNARKCIMRSHSDELRLCDLRNVTSSPRMVAEVLKGISEAFNGGNILPTVYVFPPRTINRRGPMFWNHQILQFAGYVAEDGSILGDPSSVSLTKAILELGWVPPESKSPWDLLPLVAIAEGDIPAFAEIPAYLRLLVDIRHPQYAAQFEKLGLKWVSFPALTRLGFDIGGVQYTAAPFIGWFMDAEIGVRNLADSFRYNVLPDIVQALELTHGKLGHGFETFEDLPEYEKLSMLSKAQAELTYAVNWSFIDAKITMSDSLTASMKWCQYDEEFKKKYGYRLPADPYWLAPPQGSIIPVWHRGGAPNYQPKPMISRHVQDPIKAWEREKHLDAAASQLSTALIEVQELPNLPAYNKRETKALTYEITEHLASLHHSVPSPGLVDVVQGLEGVSRCIELYFCSGGTIAEKLAAKLHQRISSHVGKVSRSSLKAKIEPLNELQASDLTGGKMFLLIVSSTGQGATPANGLAFEEMCCDVLANIPSPGNKDFQFAVFGNGDSRYSNTYNAAALKIYSLMKRMGGSSLMHGIWQGDTAAEPLPLRSLNSWWKNIQPRINDLLSTSEEASTEGSKPAEDAIQKYDDQQEELLSTLKDCTLVVTTPKVGTGGDHSLLISLDIGNESCEEMTCVQVLPFNSSAKVDQALEALCVDASNQMNLVFDGQSPTFGSFLTEFVDLERPFLELEWLKSLALASQRGLSPDSLRDISVLEVLQRVVNTDFTQDDPTLGYCLQRDICLDMPLLKVKTYSVASSPSYASDRKGTAPATGNKVDIMVKINQDGRFSDTFLNDFPTPAPLKYRFVDSRAGPHLRENYLATFVIIATGAGFGPVRCLLQWRIATASGTPAAGQRRSSQGTGISLFLGLKKSDVALATDVLEEAKSLGIIDTLNIVLSNPEKRRVYDELPQYSKEIRSKLMRKPGLVFVCAGAAAAQATKSVFENILGGDVKKILGERYVEEVF